jgi:1,2-diacylglycerol 3-alpha-glucosyltransferase
MSKAKKFDLSEVDIVIIIDRISPYHHARTISLLKSCKPTVIQLYKNDSVYSWDKLDTEDLYPVISLFENDNVPFHSMNHRLVDALNKAKPEVVMIPGWFSPSSLLAISWSLNNYIPCILMSDSTIGDQQRVFYKEWVKSKIISLFSAALVAGKRNFEYVSLLGMRPDFIFTGYDVVDNNYFRKNSNLVRRREKIFRSDYKLPQNYFLASGRFVKKKNFLRLLKAYKLYLDQIDTNPWHLVLLGDGEQKFEINRIISELKIKKFVHLVGFKQYKELPVYYGLAKAFILPSISEQWGLVVNEAMASGLPVIVSEKCGCVDDLVQDGLNGFVFDPYNIQDLANIMAHMASQSFDLLKFEKASKVVVSSISTEKYYKSVLAAINISLSNPLPKFSFFKRVLLWILMKR